MITLLYAGILGMILMLLTFRVVVVVRAKGGINMGDGGQGRYTAVIRSHGNFVEFVPFALVLMALLESNGVANTTMLHIMGVALVVSRVLHPLGMNADKATTVARFAGATSTFLIIIIASLAAVIGSLTAIFTAA